MTKFKYTKYESINHLTESLKLVLSEDLFEPRSNANPQYYKNAPREMLNSFIITIAYRLTSVNNKIHGTATQKSLKEQKKFIDNNGVDSDVQMQRKDDINHDCQEYDQNQMILREMHEAFSKLYVELYNAEHVMPAPKPAQTNPKKTRKNGHSVTQPARKTKFSNKNLKYQINSNKKLEFS